MQGAVSGLLKRAPFFLFVAALLLAGFVGGLYVARYKVFPYTILSSAKKTLGAAVEVNIHAPHGGPLKFVGVPPEQAAARRFEFIGSDRLIDPILVPGGRGYFREHCPDHVGCLAVEYAGGGEVRHAWPYRPEELEGWLEKEEFTADFPYEHAIGFSFSEHVEIMGLSQYANGDLLVVFHFSGTHPYGGGMARIDRSGKPVWYRPDYSHHRPHLTEDEVVLVPGMRLDRPRGINLLPGRSRPRKEIECSQWRHDVVGVIGPRGERGGTSVFDAVLESPYAPFLHHARRCDPTHLNSVHLLGEDAAGPNLEPGDLVVSLRNLHAFAILDRRNHRLKRLVRGGFVMQHAVLHFEGSRFLMLDNQGGRTADGALAISRLLMVDAANGEETTIFPNHRTPGHLRELYTYMQGGLALSPDRSRAIVTFTDAGKAVEVRLADGAVLVVFDSIHDVSQLDEFPEERATRAVRGKPWDVRYGSDG